MFLRSVPCVVLVDSGATHSFVSRHFCHQHALHYANVSSSALLADGVTCLSVVGVLWNSELKVSSFCCKQSLLVLDSSSSDVVLGMDWLEAHDPKLSFRKRRMHLNIPAGRVVIPALSSDETPELHSSCIELCTLDAFSRDIRSEDAVDLHGAVIASLQHVPLQTEVLTGPGADDPDVQPLLSEFCDVLVPEIPGGLPPERYARDGRPIECCIETEPDAKPYARPYPV
jgi:hypothetical protein